jgi:hypothetical protein
LSAIGRCHPFLSFCFNELTLFFVRLYLFSIPTRIPTTYKKIFCCWCRSFYDEIGTEEEKKYKFLFIFVGICPPSSGSWFGIRVRNHVLHSIEFALEKNTDFFLC